MLPEIIRCLKAMPTSITGDLRSALTNGKVEMQLKTFFGIAWVAAGGGRRRSYLMDKNMGKPKTKRNVNAPLDFVGFEGEEVAFWLEAKCDFKKGGSARKSAQDAIRQVRAYKGRLCHQLQDSQSYIVHFLCPVPKKSQHPRWVNTFEKLRKTNIRDTTKSLKDRYRKELRGQDCVIRALNIDFDPPIGVVVVEA